MGAIIFVVTLATVIIGISVYAGWVATHIRRLPLDGNPADVGLVYDDITFTAADDGVTLSGWFLPSERSSATIIVAHGIGANRLEPAAPALELARSLVDAGLNVLMFDFRNSGESDGTVTTIGYHEVKDILGAVAWLKQTHPAAANKIGLHGFSMGAVASVLAAAREPAVNAIVIDSPFADLNGYLRKHMSVWTGLPNFPFTGTIMALLPPMIGLDVAAVSPVKVMPKLIQPTLIIHGTSDRLIPVSESEQLAAAGNPHQTQMWLVPGADHVGARQEDPATYDGRVIRFFQNAFADPPPQA